MAAVPALFEQQELDVFNLTIGHGLLDGGFVVRPPAWLLNWSGTLETARVTVTITLPGLIKCDLFLNGRLIKEWAAPPPFIDSTETVQIDIASALQQGPNEFRIQTYKYPLEGFGTVAIRARTYVAVSGGITENRTANPWWADALVYGLTGIAIVAGVGVALNLYMARRRNGRPG